MKMKFHSSLFGLRIHLLSRGFAIGFPDELPVFAYEGKGCVENWAENYSMSRNFITYKNPLLEHQNLRMYSASAPDLMDAVVQWLHENANNFDKHTHIIKRYKDDNRTRPSSGETV